MIRATWYHLCNFENVKNTYGGVLLLVKLQAKARNTPLWVFFTFFKLYKWYQSRKTSHMLMIGTLDFGFK